MTADGLFDVIGFYKGETIIVELKVGKPNINKLRSAQRDVLYEALRQGGPAYCCFAHNGKVKWFRGLPLGDPIDPPFYRR
jgi:penicillin-binding protein-related factor A (putative recombinase)